ncbi:javelin isoform 1-T1 [Glossina fuscipes fuscipes]
MSKNARKSKDYIYNYVDRVRVAENTVQDYKCPARGSGWRHNNSISHLDLATSCPTAAFGLNHWSSQHLPHHQLRHSRSLDYNHIDRCKDALDIADYCWHLDHETDLYEDDENLEFEQTGSGLKYVSERHIAQQQQQQYRDFKCAEGNSHQISSNNIYPSSSVSSQHQQQQRQFKTGGGTVIPPSLSAYEFPNDSCSLRRSRSLAVIREETFNDLQISSSSHSRRRSQLIPRARLVNRGYFRERDRLIYSNNKLQQQQQQHHHHYHQIAREKSAVNGSSTTVEPDSQSNESIADTCDSHQHQRYQIQLQHQLQLQQHHEQHQQPLNQTHTHYHHDNHLIATHEPEDYYDNLKRLDALALGIAEQLHPWHNDKSDLESLNSDYFKNSLHQTHDLQPHLELNVIEKAANFLSNEKPRIYKSRRQQQQQHLIADRLHHKLITASLHNGGDSCPENSQSSVFPETTPSNSDDQTDSVSLSEQEYDLTRIEEIFTKNQLGGDDESYEIISLSAVSHKRLENTENPENQIEYSAQDEVNRPNFSLTGTTTTDTGIDTLKRERAVNENLQKIIAYDSVYLSSEEGSESTLVDENCNTSLEAASLHTCIDDVETLLHISIEDAIYEPKISPTLSEFERSNHKLRGHTIETELTKLNFNEAANAKIEIVRTQPDIQAPIYTQILKVEHTPSSLLQSNTISQPSVGVTSSVASKPKILSVVEKRKLKRYSDSAYSSNVSESSEPSLGQVSTSEIFGFTSSKLKHQSPETIERSNLSINQYHSLPDVNIGQSLKVSESIDAHLRSSYNLDNYHSLDDSVVDSSLQDEANLPTTTTSSIVDNSNDNEQKFSEKRSNSLEYLNSLPQKIQFDNDFKANKANNENNEIKIDNRNEKKIEKIEKFILQQEKEEINEGFIEDIPAALKGSEVLAPELNAAYCKHRYGVKTSSDTDEFESFEKSKETLSIEVENFSQQIERRAKEIRESGRRTKLEQIERANRAKFGLENTLYPQYNEFFENKNQTRIPLISPAFRIVVTDAQNNIIEEDSIESTYSLNERFSVKQAEILTPTIEKKLRDIKTDKTQSLKEGCKTKSGLNTNLVKVSSLRRASSRSKRQQYPQNSYKSNSETKRLLPTPKSKEISILNNQIYRARPIKVVSSTDSIRRARSIKMSRPQILHVIDNKRKTENCRIVNTSTAHHHDGIQVKNEYLKKVDAVRCYWSKLAHIDKQEQQQTQQHENEENAEVKSLHNSNLSQHGQDEYLQPQQKHSAQQMQSNEKANPSPTQTKSEFVERHEFILGSHQNKDEADKDKNKDKDNNQEMHDNKPKNDGDTSTMGHTKNDCHSFMPSIEIVELDGDKKATIVSAAPPNVSASSDVNEPAFDHIRYKVLKSQQLLRSNGLKRNKKEAQFDGLIQYLQEYSFKELLSNNNVVIVEPVRTKIERPLQATPSTPGIHVSSLFSNKLNGKKQTGIEDDAKRKSSGANSGIKRHFFYQPVRVNRELYEEELPNPDTVRNVRKFFEEHILPTRGHGIWINHNNTSDGRNRNRNRKTNDDSALIQLSPRARRARKYRYLTIDTSYGHVATAKPKLKSNLPQSRKWDSASLSSGISSGDLSSPCECNETDASSPRDNHNYSTKVNNNREIVSDTCGVHVQDIVKKHNNNPLQQIGGTGIPVRSSMRPRSTIYGLSVMQTVADNSLNPNTIRNATKHHNGDNSENESEQQKSNNRSLDSDVYDTNDMNSKDVEFGKSYYVSNDILRKIRECGSSVTYYGGRVVQNNSTVKPFQSHYNENNDQSAHNTMASLYAKPSQTTRETVNVIETCSSVYNCGNECQQHKKPKQKSDNRKSKDGSNKENNAAKVTEGCNEGIMFKLVKSNSCNSRLELAGAEYPEDTEIVRRIVHQFETHKFVTNDDSTTITNTNNSQLLVRSKLIVDNAVATECSHLPQSTVNSELNASQENEKNQNKIQKQTENKREELTTIHQGEGKHIHMENNGSDMDMTIKNGAGGAIAAKVCRNRNVDLAFILAKQQPKSAQPAVSNEIDITNIAVNNRKVATVTEASIHNDNNEISVKKIVASMHELSSERTSIANNSAAEVSQTKQSTKCYTASSPGQILVPVEIHRANDEEIQSRLLRIDNTSVFTHFPQPLATAAAMTTSGIDDAVVKYYVANDKSIYEKRRYNDIEFEEFEVYDPTKKKDFDKRIVEEKSAINQNVTDDTNVIINAKEPENPQSTVANNNNNNCISLDDKTTTHQEGYRSAETDTDCCYDSLDGKM